MPPAPLAERAPLRGGNRTDKAEQLLQKAITQADAKVPQHTNTFAFILRRNHEVESPTSNNIFHQILQKKVKISVKCLTP